MRAGSCRPRSEASSEVESAQRDRGGQVVERYALAQVLLHIVADDALLEEGQPVVDLGLPEQDVRVATQDVHRQLAGQRIDEQFAARTPLCGFRGDEHGGAVNRRVISLDLVAELDLLDIAPIYFSARRGEFVLGEIDVYDLDVVGPHPVRVGCAGQQGHVPRSAGPSRS